MAVQINPQDLIIAPKSSLGNKIYVRQQPGKYQKIRRYIGIFLMSLFVFLPWFDVGSAPAILFDLAKQQFHVFGTTLYPQDLTVFAALLMISAFLLFFITTWLGRVWCGFLCPQTHWLFMFLWVEEKIEGTRNQRKLLDRKPWSLNKVSKKGAKHIIWLSLAFFTATTFVSYFVPVQTLYSDLWQLSWGILTIFWVFFFMACTYANAGWLREKMCLHMCPYARFQSAMFDNDTLLIAYNSERGEARGPRKRKYDAKAMNLGDCVDCNLCVDVCPVGIDIRDGLQYECINCGACVDACDATMSKFNYKKGLISMTSEAALAGGVTQLFRAKVIAYGMISILILLAMALYWFNRAPLEFSVTRDRNVLYRVTNDDMVENVYRIKLFNKSNEVQTYSILIGGIDYLGGGTPLTMTVLPGIFSTKVVTITADPATIDKSKTRITLDVFLEQGGQLLTTEKSIFYSE
ncbi:MAG: cytochrome c oxidase accessory protein CcoG [Psychrobium sp.]|nr:cytochrome c oxidase accessory protein CcoG [Psychrobium sp.]